MSIINFFENLTAGQLFAMFAAFVLIVGSRTARRGAKSQLSAEQAERAEDVRKEFESAAPIAIVTSAAVVLVLVIVGAVAVWQMAIR